MKLKYLVLALIAAISSALIFVPHSPAQTQPATIRFATFNSYLNRDNSGQLITDLSTPNNAQASAVAEIIQRVNPDVLLLQEFDYDAAGRASQLFQQNYLGVSHNGTTPVRYPYVFAAPSNTGVASGFDLDNSGAVVRATGSRDYGGDAFGFGLFPGQYGMVLLSKYPIETSAVRTFQTFLWRDMPNALLPDNPNTPATNDWYSAQELTRIRLSSKNHWDVPININGKIIHVLASHPTPPVFDGPEDRNGKRNHDEIRFWADYVTPSRSNYIYDDRNQRGGLPAGASFVIMGDMNSDPLDGDSVAGAIAQLLQNPQVNVSVTPSSEGGREDGANSTHQTPAQYDTSDFNASPNSSGNLRLDYVLPSRNLDITDSGVFWVTRNDPLFRLIGTGSPIISSDHRLVWVDVKLEE